MKKHRRKILSLIIILILCIIGIAIYITQNRKEIEETSAEVEEEIEEPLEWHGNYIWDGTTENNTWMCFRKTIDLENIDQKVMAQIAVDSKYWLYINGEMVVREGALKRGETKDSIYYDEVNLTNYLKKGKNTIAVLVWYWGDTSISHNSSGQGALLFQTKIGDEYLITDETWKVQRHPAYLQDELRPNKRLIEYNVYYDASLANEKWYQPNFDDSEWANSTVLNVAGSTPWGELIERDIPQFKDYGLKEYENSEDYVDYTTTDTEILALKIPYNAQITPYLKVKAEAGQKITIKTDFYEDVNGDSVKCTYLTKKGKQEFESLAWMNGETVYYEIPAGVKILSLGYRETGYDTEMTGKFTCNDEFFNKLWNMADRTLYVNMRDTYMDCPNRERAQWWGDVSIEMLEAMYALDTSAYDLFEKGVKTTIGWRYGGILLTVTPISGDCVYLPIQMLLGVDAMYDYYQYTGKTEFLEYVYPHVKEFLNLWQVSEENGLVYTKTDGYPPVWEWGDSVAQCDYKAIENAWVYLALSRTAQMAEILGYKEDKVELDMRLQNLKENYQKLWTSEGYKMPDSSILDSRANAVAVISGLADEDKYDTITRLLTTSYDNSTFMEKYILQALCEMGKIEEAQERIQNRYDEMVNGKDSCSTLWENWNPESGSKNHAWAGGPLIIMSKYFAGIEPLEKGYDVISIKPQFGKLSQIEADVTTVKGNVKFKAEKQENSVKLKINVPAKTRVAVPKCTKQSEITINDKVIYQDNKPENEKYAQYDMEDAEYVYFYVEAGEYEMECK